MAKIEDDWIKIIDRRSGSDTIQWLKPSEHLSYQMPEKEFEIYEEDFTKTMMDYLMFREGIDVKAFSDKLLNKILYGSNVETSKEGIAVILSEGKNE